MRFILIIFLTFNFLLTTAQDTTATNHKKKNTTLAIALSAAVPGAGQIYNKKYWKVPFIYAGLYTSYYFVRKNNYAYQAYRSDILLLTDTTRTGIPVTGTYDLNVLADKYNKYRRSRDLSIMVGVLIWTLNVFDAYIDAELSDFDVSDDLSINLKPFFNLYKNQPTYGLTVSLNFK